MAPNHKEGWTLKRTKIPMLLIGKIEDLIQKQRFVFGWESKMALT